MNGSYWLPISCSLPSGISTSFHSTARTSFSNRVGCFQRARLIGSDASPTVCLAERGDQADDLRLPALVLAQAADRLVELQRVRPVDLHDLGRELPGAHGGRCPAVLPDRLDEDVKQPEQHGELVRGDEPAFVEQLQQPLSECVKAELRRGHRQYAAISAAPSALRRADRRRRR